MARAAQLKTMEKKLEGDASFFWQCVSRHEGGGVIAGTSGIVPPERDERFLFGGKGGVPPADAAIDFSRYDAIPVSRSGAGDEREHPPLADFADLADALPAWATRNLLQPDRMHYRAPTPVQKHTVPLALASLDVMACAQTGSGKTVAFLLPLLASIAGARSELSPEQLFDRLAERSGDASRPRAPRGGGGSRHASDGWRLSKRDEAARRKLGTPARPSALVLAPTRELVLQIELECAKLTLDAPPPPSGAAHWSSCAYGGATARPQLETLAAGVEILVATPGRLSDFVGRDLVCLDRCRFLVLDEADRMLDMGFEPQIRKIVEESGLPAKADGRQTLLFSATFAPPIQRVARQYLRADRTAHVSVGRVGSSVSSIEQRLVRCDGGDKKAKLSKVLPLIEPGERTIVFTGKKHVARWLRLQLERRGTAAVEIHGDRSQAQREAALASFRAGAAEVLVATDVASRGIDVPDVAHVVQFDLPPGRDDFDAYVHRIGRTGRAGKSGRATSLFVPGDEPKVGNGALWADLARILDENRQEVPDWFDACRPRGAAPRGGGAAAAGPDGEPTAKAPSTRRKGASPNRRARRAAAAAATGRPPNAGPPSASQPTEGSPPTPQAAAAS